MAPAELEAVLLSYPEVADAAVIRHPDEEAGEVPKAFVVARSPVDPEELKAFVAERVAPTRRSAWWSSSTRFPRRPRARSCAGC